jgi:ABC-2 type transport system ATP-binding protein
VKPLISLSRITKDYGHLRAIDDVTLDVFPGVTGLLGPNGAGKTTLIKVILGLVHIRHGSGNVMGFELGRQARAIRASIGYMPEDDCYLPGLSGVEMVQLAARLSGFPPIEGLRRAHEILDFCGIEQERYRDVDTYSTGMRQKLKFAQSIVHDPPFLILDEPTAGLDPEERETMLSRIRVLAERGEKAVVISTHILPDVQSICEHVIILSRGQLRVADRLDVLNRPIEPAYHVSVLGEVEELEQRARDAGFEVAPSDRGSLTLRGVEVDVAQHVFSWARDAGVAISSLVPAKNSLEQIFLEAVGEQRDAHP